MQITDSPAKLSATVAAAVRAEMARHRVSQHELAARLGWSQPRISRRLSGDVPFSLDELPPVAQAVGTTVVSLMAAPAPVDGERVAVAA